MRDMGYNKTFFFSIDFKDYMTDLKDRRENEKDGDKYFTFNRELWDDNENKKNNASIKDAYY